MTSEDERPGLFVAALGVGLAILWGAALVVGVLAMTLGSSTNAPASPDSAQNASPDLSISETNSA